MKTLLTSLRLLLVLTLLTGALYPALVWAVGQVVFRDRAEGSLIEHDGDIVGSRLLAQRTINPRYFWPRPSATDHATVASGASNQGWTSAKLTTAIASRRAVVGDAPADLLTASGSGLDPELSPAAVRIQAARVAAARSLDDTEQQELDALITRLTRGGTLSPARVNVLELNLALDHELP